MPRPPTILALASELKGEPLLEEFQRQGCHVTLLMNTRLLDEPWPAVTDRFDMPDVRVQPDVTNAVSWLARQRRFDRIVALDDYDVETAAALREHLRLPGLGDSAARLFRDKLAMRVRAREAGLPVPPFTALFNDEEVDAFLAEVPGPWLLKPRTLAGSEGIRKLARADEAWKALEALGDRRSHHLLERFVAGAVFHVDALVWKGEVTFALVSRYGTPPLAALQGRGVFSTQVLHRENPDAVALRELNAQVTRVMGRTSGPTHTEFIRGEDGSYHFLETAARVGGGNIDRLIEAATGLVIWREAARLELADLRGELYKLPEMFGGYAGMIVAPSRIPYPDTSAYTDPEIRFRPRLREFVSLIVGASVPEQVDTLLSEYAERFVRDFMP